MEVRVDQHDRFMINQAEGFVGGFFKRIFWYAEFLFALGGKVKSLQVFQDRFNEFSYSILTFLKYLK